MSRVLNTGFKFNNVEDGKFVIRPIQLKNGEYGYFNNSELNIKEPVALTFNNEIVDIKKSKPSFYYIDILDYDINNKYRKKPYFLNTKWWIKLKARIKLLLWKYARIPNE